MAVQKKPGMKQAHKTVALWLVIILLVLSVLRDEPAGSDG